MPTAYAIVLEKQIENLDSSMDGRMLARASEVLDDIANQCRVRPLTGFTSIDPAEAAAFFEDEGIDLNSAKLPPLQRFSAEEGLFTIRALIAHLTSLGSIPRNSLGIIDDLRNCERILTKAQEHEVRWHFQVGN